MGRWWVVVALAVLPSAACGFVGDEAHEAPDVSIPDTTTTEVEIPDTVPGVAVVEPRPGGQADPADPTPGDPEPVDQSPADPRPDEPAAPPETTTTTGVPRTYSPDPCDWISSATLVELLDRDPGGGQGTDSVATSRCEWYSGPAGPSFSIQVEGASVYFALLADARARPLRGVRRPAVLDGSQPPGQKSAIVQTKVRTLRVTVRAPGVTDADLVRVVNEVLDTAGL